MGEKKEHKDADNFGIGEISTIRNILMGQQMSEYEQRFGHLEEKLISASDNQGTKLQNMESKTQERFSVLEQDISKRFDTLELMLKEGLEKLHTQTQTTRENDNDALGKMFVEIGKLLSKK